MKITITLNDCKAKKKKKLHRRNYTIKIQMSIDAQERKVKFYNLLLQRSVAFVGQLMLDFNDQKGFSISAFGSLIIKTLIFTN